MTASGTAGHAAELDAYFPLSDLGAHVVKSLSTTPWAGNPAPRVHPAAAGMLNSVGLQGEGIAHWIDHDLPALERCGARTVVSIWGRTVVEYADAARALASTPVIAVEVNLSCPNLDGGAHLFAQSAEDTAAAIGAVRSAVQVPVWAKLTAQVSSITEVARAARSAGAEAVTVTNTLLAMAIDPFTRRHRLGAGRNGAGLSGPAIHAVAVRAVHDLHAADPDLAIIGVGGVTSGEDAVEMMLAGASAVQVGTATFADPRAPAKVLGALEQFCARHGVARVRELTGGVHD